MIEIAVRDLVKEYEIGQPVLDGLTFQVDTGERVGILGRNGAGKTTLFRILTGQERADSGDVIVAPGGRMGLISQIPVYPAGFTVEDVLRSAFDELRAMERELHTLSEELAGADRALLDRYDRLQVAFETGGGYEIETRMMLDGFVTDSNRYPYPGAHSHALNDIVITRSRGLQILNFNVSVDGQFLNRFNADGMIISTATGSTAYNMSAGGPIVEPKARLILLTPISPHTLNNRSIVLSADDKISIELMPPRNEKKLYAECVFDGTGNIELHSGDKINISTSCCTTRLIRLSRRSFLETLHKKITS